MLLDIRSYLWFELPFYICSYMDTITMLWFYLVTVGECIRIHSKVITVNNNGNISPLCCTTDLCICASLPQALSSITNNTIINITSQIIPLHGLVLISGSNISITSSVGTTIMCNNIGAMYCDQCNNFTIKTIKWDSCGIKSKVFTPGIFLHRVSNISIINCTFQNFKVCVTVCMEHAEGSINIINSNFMFNSMSNALSCNKHDHHSSLLIMSNKSLDVIICGSLFYQNGIIHQGTSFSASLVYINQQYPPTLSLYITCTSFISSGFNAIRIHDTATKSSITLNKVNISDNGIGALITMIGKTDDKSLDITSCHFLHNNNGVLLVHMIGILHTDVHKTTFINNKGGTTDTFGSVLFFTGGRPILNISLCNFYDNVGGNIVYIHELLNVISLTFCNVSITSSNFTGNKIGSVLHFKTCVLNFYSTTSFENNSARRGSAIYITEGTQISMGNGSSVLFINNTASLRGGAIIRYAST